MTHATAIAGPVPGRAIGADTLADALLSETRLLQDLAGVLRRQREGVARDDVQVVDDSVFAAHRVMRTLEEARRRRRTIIGVLLGAEDVPIGELDGALGRRMTPALAGARDQLQAAAQILAREIAINREVLRSAIETGDRVVRALCGGRTPATAYDASARTAHGRQGGVLLNQSV